LISEICGVSTQRETCRDCAANFYYRRNGQTDFTFREVHIPPNPPSLSAGEIKKISSKNSQETEQFWTNREAALS
jgi:hypothetical protein